MGLKKCTSLVQFRSEGAGALLDQLKKYGLNPREWILDWSQSQVVLESEDRNLEFIKDIQIVSRANDDIIFKGGAYRERKQTTWITDWFGIEMMEI